MRNAISVLLAAAALFAVGSPRQAAATITVTLEWGACGGGNGCFAGLGTSTVTLFHPASGQTLRLDVFLSHDVALGLEQHSFSLNFDTSLDNELNYAAMPATEWNGTDVHPGNPVSTYSALSPGVTSLDSTGAVAGRANSFESAGLSGVLPATGAA